ncbi:lipoyl domain-containing protein [Micromonospora sp. NPDC003776]
MSMLGKNRKRSAALLTGAIVFLVAYILTGRSLFVRVVVSLFLVYTVVELVLLLLARRGTSGAGTMPAERAGMSSAGVGAGQVGVLMPPLGEGVESATVLRWITTAGETVEAGQPLAEISTDKVETEVVSPAAGTVAAILVRADQVAAVGTPIAVISPAADGLASAQT